jgi:hypothetical protein
MYERVWYQAHVIFVLTGSCDGYGLITPKEHCYPTVNFGIHLETSGAMRSGPCSSCESDSEGRIGAVP